MTPLSHIGLPWFRREHFARVQHLVEVGRVNHERPGAYDEWLAYAHRISDRFNRNGTTVVRVEIEPEQFTTWCAAEGREANTDACAEFASRRAAEVFVGLRQEDTFDE